MKILTVAFMLLFNVEDGEKLVAPYGKVVGTLIPLTNNVDPGNKPLSIRANWFDGDNDGRNVIKETMKKWTE